MAEFGETVWYLRLKSGGRDKLKYRWGSGVWLGTRQESGESWVGTERGVIKVRDIIRKGSHAESWNADNVKSMVGVPWRPNPERSDPEAHINIPVPSEGIRSEPVRGVPVHTGPWSLYILPKDTRDPEIGLTPGCKGCEKLNAGLPQPRHTIPCRMRIGKILAKRGDERVSRRDLKII